MISAKEWLSQDPPAGDIESIAGVNVIRQKKIEALLDELTECNWETPEFKVTRFFDVDGKEWIDASLLLVVNYGEFLGQLPKNEKYITRRISGAVTYDIARFGQLHSSNTAKSLALVNAAGELGSRMGRNLNPSVEPVIEGKKMNGVKGKLIPPVKFKATPDIITSYNKAIAVGNEQLAKSYSDIYEIPEGE